jgi:hypothetical protein
MTTCGVFMNNVYHVVRFYPLHGCKLVRIFVTPSEMGDGLITVFKHSNSTLLCCYENYMDDVDYFVVMT